MHIYITVTHCRIILSVNLTYLIKVFSIFQECKISVDVVASSDVSLSLTLDNKQCKSGNVAALLVRTVLHYYTYRVFNISVYQNQLRAISEVVVLEDRAIVSLISNLERSSEVMAIAFQVMQELG